MTIRRLGVPLLTLCLALPLSSIARPEGSGQVVSAQTSSSVTLSPVSITNTEGTTGGQPVSALGVEDQSGTANDWNKYVEFDGLYTGYRTYDLSTSVAPSSVSVIAVSVNYQGPAKVNQDWTWSIYDWLQSKWVAVGDNGAAPDWGAWTLLRFSATGALANYVNPTSGQIRVQVSSNNASDNMDLDYESVSVTYGSQPQPTSTSTSIAATATRTPTRGTSTNTPVPPTATRTPTRGTSTNTPVLPTATRTPTRATSTNTPVPPTATQAPAPGSSLWRPTPGTTWFWEIGATPNLSSLHAVQAYDIDGFDNPASTVATLHSHGIRAICYMDGGTYENWRPDAGSFPSGLLGSSNGWPGENWLDVRPSGAYYGTLKSIMQSRAQDCKSHGFDAIEWDNVDGYTNSTGFPITAADQIAYNTFLAGAAHAVGLSVALKNDTDQVSTLQPRFDFGIDEECFLYSECSSETPFINANKAVLEVEYQEDGMTTSKFCPQANAMRFSSALATLNLDGPWTPCW